MSDLRSLVRRGRDLDIEVKAKTEELKTIKAKLIAAGAGEHAGTDGARALVTFPAPSLKPGDAAIAAVRLAVGETYFERLFSKVITYKPAKGFREILRVLLKGQPAEELITACEEPSAPQVRFS